MFSNFSPTSRHTSPKNHSQTGLLETDFPAGPTLRTVNRAALKWGMHRLVAGRSQALRDVATRSWELSPAETLSAQPAIHLPNALDRVNALSPWRDWDKERRFIDGGKIEHAASQAHLIEGVNISGAFLYCGAAKMKAGYGDQKLVRTYRSPVKHLEEAHLLSDWTGSCYFGMFMRAVLPMQLLPEDGAPTISMRTKPYIHVDGYREMLSMPCPPMVADARVDRLTVYTDFGQNASKLERYSEMRRRLRKAVGPTKTQSSGVYLKRGDTGEPRIVSNEAELEATLTALGFDIVEPHKLSSLEIAQRLVGVPIVVSVEGSHMAHAIYTLAEGGTLLALQPPDRLALAFKEFTDRVGLRFAFTVGHPDTDGFRVDIDDLKRTLDLVEQQRPLHLGGHQRSLDRIL